MDELLAEDPYITLGVSKDADSPTIKTAYRKLAIKHHPDKCAAEDKEEATKKFHIIQEAYDHIGTDENRKKYDDLVRLYELRDKMRNMRTRTEPTPRSGPTRSYTYSTSSSSRPSQSMADIVYEALRKNGQKNGQSSSHKSESESRRYSDRSRDDREHLPRSRTYDSSDGHRMYDEEAHEKLRRKADEYRSTEHKYSSLAEEAKRHQSGGQPRPSVSSRRTTSYRGSPRYDDDEIRRSRASPRVDRHIDEEEEFDEKAKESARMFRDILERKRREREALEREREREREYAVPRDYERVPRPREERRGRERSRLDEDVRPPPLKQSHSDVPDSTFSPPSFSRSKTMPIPEASSSSKREKRGSHLKTSMTMDSGYSSSSQPEDKYSSRKSRPTVKKHTYSYTTSPARIPEDMDRKVPPSRERVSPKHPSLSSPRGSYDGYSSRRREPEGSYFPRPDERSSGELFGEVRNAPHPIYATRYPDERTHRQRDDAYYPTSPRYHRQYSTTVAS
jgi:curved DNA-binding protein CbpA